MLMRLLVLCASLLLLSTSARADAVDSSFGVHGMVLFGGEEGLYASHLPMFHAPHDAQVVLSIRFADPALDRRMRARLHGRTALWTLEPERFPLRQLAPGAANPPRSLSVNVVEGHFEQGGVVRYQHAQLLVEKVVLFRSLDPAPSVQTMSRYMPVGPFLLKLVDSRPDFDHIVLLKQPARGIVSVPKTGMEPGLGALGAEVPVVGTLYYCADDLK